MMTSERNFQLTIASEIRPASVAAKSYGRDVIKMLREPGFFKPELIGLYARIAAHFGRRAILREPGFFEN